MGSVADVSGVKKAANRVPDGPCDADTDFGPLNSTAQLTQVRALLERLPANAEVVAGGAALNRPGVFHEATVVAGLRQEDEIVQGEVFGPVVTVHAFADEEEALRPANGVPQGPGGEQVDTRDHDRAMRCTPGSSWSTRTTRRSRRCRTAGSGTLAAVTCH